MRVYLDVSLTLVSRKATRFMCSHLGLQGGRRTLEMNHNPFYGDSKSSQKRKKSKQIVEESDESSNSV